jgi:hypothetical protein
LNNPIAELYSWKVTFRPTMSMPFAMPFGKRVVFDSSISRAVSTAPQTRMKTSASCSIVTGLVLVHRGGDLEPMGTR